MKGFSYPMTEDEYQKVSVSFDYPTTLQAPVQKEKIVGKVSIKLNNDLLFEEYSELYWKTIRRQAVLLRDAGFVGTVVRTTSGPEDPSWIMRRQDYIEANGLFLA